MRELLMVRASGRQLSADQVHDLILRATHDLERAEAAWRKFVWAKLDAGE